jgi:hypothetical protein
MLSIPKIPLAPVLAFVLVSSPETYKLTSKFLGEWVSNGTGRPQIGGLVLHALVFLLVLMLIKKFLPQISGYEGEEGMLQAAQAAQ